MLDLDHYSTIKRVKLRAPVIKKTYYTVIFIVVLYVVLSTILLHRYATFENVIPVINVWPFMNGNFTQMVKESDDSYCNNSRFDIIQPALDTIKRNLPCRSYDDLNDIVKVTGNEISVTTMMWEQPLECHDYFCSNFSFVRGVEGVSFAAHHGFWAKSTGTVINPHTVGPDRDIVDSKAGLTFTVREVLKLANVDLNAINVGGSIELPYRATGTRIIISLEYSKLRNWDLSTEVICKMSAEALPGLWGTGAVETGSNTRLLRASLFVTFQGRGVVGAFDEGRVVLAILSGVVLLGVGKKITEEILTRRGRKNYEEVVTENDLKEVLMSEVKIV